MVQRKVPTKLVIQFQPHHLKTQTLFHHHDLKYNNKGSDLKKKMMKTIKRPKHPPSPVVKTARPNYMKPTTSSDARKEQPQSPVSTRNNSILRRRSLDSLKHGESSGKRETKTLLGRSLTKSPSFKPSRGSARRCSPVGLCENLDAQRTTCSSTLKDCKFPAYLSLNQGGTESEGTSAVKVCPYTYCSLNGHHHDPLPPLRCFLSARRRTIKTQRSVKLGCLSPRREKPVAEEDNDFFVEIYSKKDEEAGSGGDQEPGVLETLSDSEARDETPLLVEEERNVGLLNELPADVHFEQIDDSEASDMGYQSSLHLDYDYEYEYTLAIDMEPDPEASKNRIINDEFIIYSDGKDCGFDEVSQESYEESINSDAFSSSDEGESSCDHLEEHSESAGDDDDDKHILSETLFNNPSDESLPNEDAIAATEEQVPNMENFDEDIITSSTVDSGKERHSEGVLQNSGEGDHIKDDLRPETDETALARVTAKSKKPVDDLGCFNPRGPNFLPLEAESDGEKVDLRHQDLDERKNSEEWMVDYALRQVVTKLAPARKKKVALLVEAFEKVMPTRKVMHSSAFDEARTMQACI
ncbi:hypothetical protein ACS0TY_003214 [Phlomoides rotata]